MSYIGNTPTQQNFVAGADQFSGNGSTVAFTLSRSVNTVFDIFVTVSNVPQDPFTAYTVAGNTLTFDSAPPSGTNNIDVVYRATNVQTFVPSPGATVGGPFGIQGNLNFFGTGNRITGDFSNATVTSRVLFQTSTTDNVSNISVIPNGTSTSAAFTAYNNSNPTDAGLIQIASLSADSRITSGRASVSGTYLPMTFYTNGSERMRIDTSGNLQFNSGYGSVATAYGCRAWVNFDGTSNTANLSGTYSQSGTTVTVTATAHGLIAGNVVYSDITTGTAVDGTYTVATVISSSQFTYTAGTSLTTSGNVTLRRNTIRASGNVSSIADNGTGDYTVNFSTAMPDANFETNITASDFNTSSLYSGSTAPRIPTVGALATGSVRVYTGYLFTSSALQDQAYINVAVFR